VEAFAFCALAATLILGFSSIAHVFTFEHHVGLGHLKTWIPDSLRLIAVASAIVSCGLFVRGVLVIGSAGGP